MRFNRLGAGAFLAYLGTVTAEEWHSCTCSEHQFGFSCQVVSGRRQDSKDALAEGLFLDDVEKDGWGKLWINGDNSIESRYAAGFLEGALTASHIRHHFDSWFSATFPEGQPLEEATKQFLLDNYKFAKSLVSVENTQGNEYYVQLGALLAQMEGLLAGVNHAAQPGESMSLIEMLLLQAAGDLYDIIPATKPSAFKLHVGKLSHKAFRAAWHDSVSCSAIIKLQDDLQDVVLGHTTWSTFENMLRIYKHYSFAGQSEVSPAVVSFSSKPGLLYSKDDFYVLPLQNMVVMETTNGIMNQSMYEKIVPESLLTWHRIPIVNSMARSGGMWTNLFAKYNSGTYANQWMIVDMKRFIAGQGVSQGFLHITEVAPQIAEQADVTSVFKKQGNYWPSMNVPFFERVYNESGFRHAFETYGDEYSYEKCPRHQIFQRDHTKVQSLSAIKSILRYNDYKNDPLSKSDPVNAISSRKDLEKENPKAFGGIDTKVTSSRMLLRGCADAENGPTHNQQPAFRWSTSPFAKNVHTGQPDLFNFTFVQHCGMSSMSSNSIEII